MITVECKGDFKKTNSFFEKLLEIVNIGVLDKFGKAGVEALAAATPKDTGKTADSWYYEIERQNGSVFLSWYNSNLNEGVNVAVILQYGHGTGNGAYVQGIDYINPALEPIFDKIAKDAWKEVIGI